MIYFQIIPKEIHLIEESLSENQIGKMKTNWLGKNFSKKNCVRSLIERSKVGYLIIRISVFGL